MADSREEQIVSFDTVHAAEKVRIDAQRRNRNAKHASGKKFRSVSISGGGIRSASFALGVLQALNADGKVLPKVDYLSTVSGGGYIGSAWTWFNYLHRKGEIPKEEGYFFPFGHADEGVRSDRTSIQNRILSYIRQHSSYLVPGFGLSYLSAFAVVGRNMLMPLTVYIALLVAFFCMLHAIQGPVMWQVNQWLANWGVPFSPPNLSMLIGAASVAFTVLLAFVYGPVTFRLSRTSTRAYEKRTQYQRIMGYTAAVSIFFFVIGLLPVFIKELSHAIATTSGGLLGVLGGFVHFVRQQQNKKTGLPMQVIVIGSSVLMIVAILALAYFISMKVPGIWPYALAGGVFFGFFINLNQYGLGRMYRDRLIETFMPDPVSIEEGRWHLAKQAGITQLDEVCTDEDLGPYHLVNTNLILIDSSRKKFRSRGGDNFVLSPLYCGGDAIGWTETADFNGKDLTLATAMATSGAAVNPHTGANSQGITKNPLISFLMFILGLRLGLYVRNPLTMALRMPRPNLFAPGFFQGLLGMGFDTSSDFLALSDGGHFENMAAYELIRRRVDVIVTSEAGQDVDFTFGDIANFVEKVRVDFGVHIRFIEEYDLRFLLPGSAEPDKPFTDKYPLARRGFAIAEIYYPRTTQGGEALEEKKGHLFFIKATMTKNLPADVYGYQDQHPEFPNQTTADQFFNEVQLEAYRELGYHLTAELKDNAYFREAFDG